MGRPSRRVRSPLLFHTLFSLPPLAILPSKMRQTQTTLHVREEPVAVVRRCTRTGEALDGRKR
jgi:hypothetical protein